MQHGIVSVDEATRRGVGITTGEEWSRIGGKRDFISFTDDFLTAYDYSTMSNKENALSFGIVFGISEKDLDYRSCNRVKTVPIHSDLAEIGIIGEIPVELIKIAMVPPDKVDFVKKLIGDRGIMVAPMDTSKQFFYSDPCGYGIEINEKKMNKLAKERNKSGIKRIIQLLHRVFETKTREEGDR